MEQIEALTTEVRGLRTESEAIRQQMRMRSRFGALVVALMVAGLVVLGGMWWQVSHQLSEQERRWCPMMAIFLPIPGQPPTTLRGKAVASQAQELYKTFGCPSK